MRLTDNLTDAIREMALHGGDLTIEEIIQGEATNLAALTLAEYLSAADEVVRAAIRVRAVIREALAGLLGDGAMRYGDTIYRNGSTTNWKVTDPEGLAAWLGPDWSRAIRVDGGNLRRATLRAIAKDREVDPQAVIDTFIEVTYSDRDLQIVPLEKAPKYLQALQDGEITSPKGPGPGDDPAR